MVNQFIRSLRFENLTTQQKRTLKGQALSGDLAGAKKGLEKIKRGGQNEIQRTKGSIKHKRTVG